MTKFQWEFFLAQDVAGFDRLAERQGDDAAEFFNLFYADGWRGPVRRVGGNRGRMATAQLVETAKKSLF